MTGATGLGAGNGRGAGCGRGAGIGRGAGCGRATGRDCRDMRFASAFTTEAETDCDTLCSCPATAAFDCGSKDEMMLDTVCANVEAEVLGKFDICCSQHH
ncbi:hypothetical protein CDAR_525561 [Caerostris darwini]|uniref:Uncharacterized protein n=1 Tax=Caerostris darwini TaxID=1538125 RepID=A0AAV4VL08_9ARAC|nr:hypothetical protein CDAR_525561 [Caerostris darwini]